MPRGDSQLLKRPASLAASSTTTRPVGEELQAALNAARTLPPEALPGFLGSVETIRATAWARLAIPVQSAAMTDKLIGVEEASLRLGISKAFLYRNSARFEFTRRIGRKLCFSSVGIDQYIRARR